MAMQDVFLFNFYIYKSFERLLNSRGIKFTNNINENKLPQIIVNLQ